MKISQHVTCNLYLQNALQFANVYFYRQVKIIIKRIQNCPDTLVGGEKIELNLRYDAIKIQSLTYYLLSAPLFKNMIQFA